MQVLERAKGRDAPSGGILDVVTRQPSNDVNPCGVFFTLFLRSFILLRESECVVEPPWSEADQKATTGVRGVLPFCNTHASMV